MHCHETSSGKSICVDAYLQNLHLSRPCRWYQVLCVGRSSVGKTMWPIAPKCEPPGCRAVRSASSSAKAKTINDSIALRWSPRREVPGSCPSGRRDADLLTRKNQVGVLD